jgi:hypothetical protein
MHEPHQPVADVCLNEKAAKRGEEEPLKVNDHGPDACRYGVHTKIPAWRLAA